MLSNYAMAGRFISPFVTASALQQLENDPGFLASTDVSFYEDVDSDIKSTAGQFLDQLFEEDGRCDGGESAESGVRKGDKATDIGDARKTCIVDTLHCDVETWPESIPQRCVGSLLTESGKDRPGLVMPGETKAASETAVSFTERDGQIAVSGSSKTSMCLTVMDAGKLVVLDGDVALCEETHPAPAKVKPVFGKKGQSLSKHKEAVAKDSVDGIAVPIEDQGTTIQASMTCTNKRASEDTSAVIPTRISSFAQKKQAVNENKVPKKKLNANQEGEGKKQQPVYKRKKLELEKTGKTEIEKLNELDKKKDVAAVKDLTVTSKEDEDTGVLNDNLISSSLTWKKKEMKLLKKKSNDNQEDNRKEKDCKKEQTVDKGARKSGKKLGLEKQMAEQLEEKELRFIEQEFKRLEKEERLALKQANDNQEDNSGFRKEKDCKKEQTVDKGARKSGKKLGLEKQMAEQLEEKELRFIEREFKRLEKEERLALKQANEQPLVCCYKDKHEGDIECRIGDLTEGIGTPLSHGLIALEKGSVEAASKDAVAFHSICGKEPSQEVCSMTGALHKSEDDVSVTDSSLKLRATEIPPVKPALVTEAPCGKDDNEILYQDSKAFLKETHFEVEHEVFFDGNGTTKAVESVTINCRTAGSDDTKIINHNKQKLKCKPSNVTSLKGKGQATSSKRKQDLKVGPSSRKKHKSSDCKSAIWVQCTDDKCQKWRWLKDCHDPAQLPEKWVCSMNTDVNFSSCSVPEEEAFELRDSQEFVYSQFIPGSVIWAKMSGYPWWPAMVEEDPDDETFYECDDGRRSPTKYHVVFFGKPVSRAWISCDGIKLFTGTDNENGQAVPVKYRQGLQTALQQANSALQMDVAERLETLSFSRRYHQKGGRKRSSSSQEDD